jgi:hypothetical protein
MFVWTGSSVLFRQPLLVLDRPTTGAPLKDNSYFCTW